MLNNFHSYNLLTVFMVLEEHVFVVSNEGAPIAWAPEAPLLCIIHCFVELVKFEACFSMFVQTGAIAGSETTPPGAGM